MRGASMLAPVQQDAKTSHTPDSSSDPVDTNTAQSLIKQKEMQRTERLLKPVRRIKTPTLIVV